MSSSKKLETALSLIQVAETNLKNAQNLILQLSQEKGLNLSPSTKTIGTRSKDEETSLEVQEGYFDGESMVGDNGQIYPVPQNYASKTQLIVGDRMKWILTNDRDIFKLIQPAPRQRVTGTFNIEGDNYVVLVDEYPSPIKILKASATYAIKNLGLKPGDEVAIYVPKDSTPTWGAFIAVVRATDESSKPTISSQEEVNEALEEDIINELKLNEDGPASAVDYF